MRLLVANPLKESASCNRHPYARTRYISRLHDFSAPSHSAYWKSITYVKITGGFGWRKQKKCLPFLYKTQYHTLGEGNSRYCQTASLSLRESWKCCHGIEVVWTFMKFKICLYFWVVFGPWRSSVASYTTDERAKNGQKERWRWNLEELMLLTKSSLEKFRRLHFINPFLRVSNLLPKLLTFDTL